MLLALCCSWVSAELCAAGFQTQGSASLCRQARRQKCARLLRHHHVMNASHKPNTSRTAGCTHTTCTTVRQILLLALSLHIAAGSSLASIVKGYPGLQDSSGSSSRRYQISFAGYSSSDAAQEALEGCVTEVLTRYVYSSHMARESLSLLQRGSWPQTNHRLGSYQLQLCLTAMTPC